MSSLSAYGTHAWETILTPSTPSEPSERVCVCRECGLENLGHPDEFPEIEYPGCEEMED